MYAAETDNSVQYTEFYVSIDKKDILNSASILLRMSGFICDISEQNIWENEFCTSLNAIFNAFGSKSEMSQFVNNEKLETFLKYNNQATLTYCNCY